MTCERCGKVGHVAYSYRLEQRVCWRCYHCSSTSEELDEAERVRHQGAIARVIRGAAARAGERRRQQLRDRALLIETADSVDEVLVLVDEVRALGVRLEVKR